MKNLLSLVTKDSIIFCDLIPYVLGKLSVISHSSRQNQKLLTSPPNCLPLWVSPFLQEASQCPRLLRFAVLGHIKFLPLQLPLNLIDQWGLWNVNCTTELSSFEARGPVIDYLGESGGDTSPNLLGDRTHPIAIVQRRSQVEAFSRSTCSSWEMVYWLVKEIWTGH